MIILLFGIVLEEVNARTVEALQQEKDKARQLGKCKSKLEAELVECEEQLQLEKKGRADLDRVRATIEEGEIVRRDPVIRYK